MNKLTLLAAATLFSLPALAGTENHFTKSVSVDYFQSSNDFTAEWNGQSNEITNDSTGVAAKFNWEYISGGSFFLGYQYESFDIGLYDDLNNPLHSFILGGGKEWVLENKLAPYIQGTFSFGFMSIDDSFYDTDSANALGGKVGVGLGYYIANGWRANIGLDAQYRSWSPIEIAFIDDIEISETSIIWSVGIKKKF